MTGQRLRQFRDARMAPQIRTGNCKEGKKRRSWSAGKCANRACNATSSPMWRKGWKVSEGEYASLCNACGIKYRKGELCALCFEMPTPGCANASFWLVCDGCCAWVHLQCAIERVGEFDALHAPVFTCSETCASITRSGAHTSWSSLAQALCDAHEHSVSHRCVFKRPTALMSSSASASYPSHGSQQSTRVPEGTLLRGQNAQQHPHAVPSAAYKPASNIKTNKRSISGVTSDSGTSDRHNKRARLMSSTYAAFQGCDLKDFSKSSETDWAVCTAKGVNHSLPGEGECTMQQSMIRQQQPHHGLITNSNTDQQHEFSHDVSSNPFSSIQHIQSGACNTDGMLQPAPQIPRASPTQTPQLQPSAEPQECTQTTFSPVYTSQYGVQGACAQDDLCLLQTPPPGCKWSMEPTPAGAHLSQQCLTNRIHKERENEHHVSSMSMSEQRCQWQYSLHSASGMATPPAASALRSPTQPSELN